MPENSGNVLRERRPITQEQISRYGEVSGANDPIHVDPELAKHSRFGGTVAQGFLLYAWLSEMIMRMDADAWSARGRIDVKFRAPTKPGDTIDVCCRRVSGDAGVFGEYEVWCENQDGTRVLSGRAWLPEPGSKPSR